MKKFFLRLLAITVFSPATFAADLPFAVDGVERLATAEANLAIPVPKGLYLTREQPSPGDSTKIALRTGMGGLRMTIAFTAGGVSRSDGGKPGGSMMNGDRTTALVDEYAREGVRATVRTRTRLDFGGGDVSAGYVTLRARKECKPYTLGTAEGVATVSGVSIPFTIRLFQGDAQSDEALVGGWLDAFHTLNAGGQE